MFRVKRFDHCKLCFDNYEFMGTNSITLKHLFIVKTIDW